MDALHRKKLLERITKLCKKVRECPYCKAVNGTVKKITALKLIHERYKVGKLEDPEFANSFDEAGKFNSDIKNHIGKAQEDLNPIRVLHLFKRIISQDVEILNMDPINGRPERLILTTMLVPPVAIRPSVNMESQGSSNEDDLTIKLSEIVFVNENIRNFIAKGAPMRNVMQDWDYLQTQCAMFINSELPGVPLSLKPAKPIRGLTQRLKGKAGRFRGNLSGKRVDFSGRTVISPDPNLGIDEVGVPELIARVMTYPERVTEFNLRRMQQYVLNGPDRHPGANYVNHVADKSVINLGFGSREKIAAELEIGDVVERHIINGDVLLFNRQPSLHKLSIMAHKARVMPWRTLRFNECVCTPYNADFDGDEMNVHLPQTEEARAEALILMGVVNNLITPRNGEPLVAATQDFLTGGYLLTKRDAFFDRAQFTQMCTFMGDGVERIDLPPPAIIKPVELWTGKQIFSVLIRPNYKSHVLVNLETSSKNYSGGGGRKGEPKIPYLCRNDGWIYFRNSDLVCGTLDKSILGSGTKTSLFHALLRDFSPEIAANCMSRLAKLCARWLGDQGFSIGIPDVQPSRTLTETKNKIVMEGYSKCQESQKEYAMGKLVASPGSTLEQELEARISGSLNEIREEAGKKCVELLHPLNSPLIMSLCGSKGSVINIAQMIACVGQQIVNGKRIPNGFGNRTLPHFDSSVKIPEAKGFVKNSFFTGLTATEFFFHTMGGREGLVDTAVKTAETGYMQRRLMKALEDLSTQYDYTVRNSYGGIVQFIYGDDGLDPAGMEAKDRPVEIPRLLMSVKAQYPTRNEKALLPEEIKILLEQHLASPKFADCTDKFKDELREFFYGKGDGKGYVENLIILRKLFSGLDPEVFESTLNNLHRLSKTQLEHFTNACIHKYQRAKIEPGTAVGALGAQSIGEPGTQMTLKTFHFAGVASMNVTLGVPRIKEIINASKKITTPIITAILENNVDKQSALLVKGRIERTTLGDIAQYIQEVYKPSGCYLSVKLNRNVIDALQLDIDSKDVVRAIIANKKLKLKEEHVKTHGANKVHIESKDKKRETMLYSLQFLKTLLPAIIVKGIPTIERVVFTRAKDKGNYLVVEGMNLLAVMATPGIKSTHTASNHVAEMEKYLGIEAARSTIMSEIDFTMTSYKMSIDSRHMMLLADVMTYKGETLGITRFGIAKMKESVLMLASFEKTADHLFDASVHARVDDIVGVSECIIMGIPVPLGTGLFKIIHKSAKAKLPKRPLLLD